MLPYTSVKMFSYESVTIKVLKYVDQNLYSTVSSPLKGHVDFL